MICISTKDRYIYFDIGNVALKYFSKSDIENVLEEMRKYTKNDDWYGSIYNGIEFIVKNYYDDDG